MQPNDLCNLWIVRLILNFSTLAVQVNTKAGAKDRVQTYLSYILEVQPKKWIPVALIEGVVCHEITCNLTSVRNVALRHKHVHGSHWSIQPDVWLRTLLPLPHVSHVKLYCTSIYAGVYVLYNVSCNLLISVRQDIGYCTKPWKKRLMRNVTCGEEEVASAGWQICNLFRGDDYLQALQPRLAKTHPKVIFVHLIHFCQF